jgi:AAA domain
MADQNLLKEIGHGLLSGQWGTGKTFEFFDVAACVMTGQPFLGHKIKRQCGVLLIAAEGQDEVEIRLSAVVREKCGGMQQVPFLWYEQTPVLLHKNSVKTLVAMVRQAEAEFEEKFGIPLGLIGIDTIVAAAGYIKSGDESDNAVGQAIMNVLKAVAQEIKCFVLGIDHFGKDQTAGTRGAGSKESSGDVVLACLGDRQVDGNVTNTRLAVRKHRGGQQGQVYPFTLRRVELGTDEDGDPVTTMIVDWLPPGTATEAPAPDDPWAKPKRQDQRTAALRLKRVLMTILADQGVDLPIPPDGPVVRMVDQKLVRKAFYACTPAEGTPEQMGRFRRKFLAALDWAEQQQLIGAGEVNEVSYLWLARPEPEDDQEQD